MKVVSKCSCYGGLSPFLSPAFQYSMVIIFSLSLFFFWGREGERSSYIRMSFGGCLGDFLFILLDDLVLTAFYQDGLWSKRSFTRFFLLFGNSFTKKRQP